MVHLRIVAPADLAAAVLRGLSGNRSVCNVVHLRDVAHDSDGDLILADVAREDASVILEDLKALGVPERGSIVLTDNKTQLSAAADAASRHAEGEPTDAVVWEQVEAETNEQTELSVSFVAFMVLSGLLCSIAIFQDSAVLLVGAMVVGPEFGPIAGLCVAIATRRPEVAWRSGRALLVGFPFVIVATVVATLIFELVGLVPRDFDGTQQSLANLIANPDGFAFVAAAIAGGAGVLSLTAAKSGAIVGVLVSVTTIPAAAYAGITIAFTDWSGLGGSIAQLAVNLAAIFVAGTVTLLAQRAEYERRRRRYVNERAG